MPLSFLFGWFTDFGMWLVSGIPVPNYLTQIAMVLIGIAILGFGIALSVVANVILNSGEAFVKAVSDTFHLDFGNVKVVFDVSCVLIALVLSLLLFDFSVVGIREGTVISALLAGVVVKRVSKVVRAPLERVLSDNPQKA